jgi:hypothetical protein
MPDLREPSLLGDLLGPALDGLALDLDAPPAGAAGEVVMMSVGLAPPVQGLTAGIPDRVHPARLAEYLQVPVDRRQAHGFAAFPELGVDLLSAAEPWQSV